jgi:hypothetical protein
MPPRVTVNVVTAYRSAIKVIQHFSFAADAPDNKLIDIERRKNRLLKFCYVPATSAAHNRLLFFFFCWGHLQY